MDNVYIRIDGVDYIIPIAVIGSNQKLFEEYLKKNNNLLYLDVDKMIDDNKSSDLLRLYEHTVKSIEMNSLAMDGDYIEAAMKISNVYNDDKVLAKKAFKKNDISGYEIVLNGLKRALNFYNAIIIEK